jgi:hypothetical protein
MPDIKFGVPGYQTSNNDPAYSSYVSSLPNLLPARVLDIILDDNHPKFKDYGEWNSIGLIFYSTNLVESFPLNFIASANSDINQSAVAYPLYANIKNYPLRNEIIYLLNLPSNELLENPLQTIPYYLPPINIWNSQHHNGIPQGNQLTNQDVINDYKNTVSGSYRRVTDTSTDIDLGETFKERIDVSPLLPYEGDIIYEGRWGNSIRLGSTVDNSFIKNDWSSTGVNGDPILIIRNGQGSSYKEPWIPVLENINNDPSSIYLTSTQKLPLFISSVNKFAFAKSTAPITPTQYAGEQIVLNSGRLVFNSKTDSIILSANRQIQLTCRETLGIDAKQISLSAEKVYLGSAEGTEEGIGAALQPLVLGENLNLVLADIAVFLNTLNSAFQGAVDSTGAPIVSLNSIACDAKTLGDDILKICNKKDLLSKTVKTK